MKQQVYIRSDFKNVLVELTNEQVDRLVEFAQKLESQESDHFAGWAPGHLQHHLIWDHDISPTDAPYDGELDRIHREQPHD